MEKFENYFQIFNLKPFLNEFNRVNQLIYSRKNLKPQFFVIQPFMIQLPSSGLWFLKGGILLKLFFNLIFIYSFKYRQVDGN